MAKVTKPRLKPGEVLPIPIQCSGTGCDEETALLLPGKLPYRQGIWLEDGWQVFNHLENRGVLFLCAGCREKGERSSAIAQRKVRVNLRG